MNKNKMFLLTVGIPTYYGGKGLVKAVESVLSSKNVDKFRFIVCVDGNPLGKEIERKLKELGVEVVLSKKRGGQLARIKQIIKMTKTKLLVLTQDDVKADRNMLSKSINAFVVDSDLTMISARLKPFPAKSHFERAIEIGDNVKNRISNDFRNGDNYLQASGRCLAFRTSFVKKFKINELVINSDAYLYFLNRFQGGKFKALNDAIVYNRSPKTIQEHLKQSRKFQYSKDELVHFLKVNLTDEYKIPGLVGIKALVLEFFKHPIHTALYVCVFIYTSLFGRNMYSNAKRFWDTDVSTKEI